MSNELTKGMIVFCSFLVLYNVLFSGIHFPQNEEVLVKREASLEKRNTGVDYITSALAIILLYAIIIFFIWDQRIPKVIPFVLFTLPYMLRHLILAIKASGSFVNIIVGKENEKKLSEREKNGFETFVIGILTVCVFFPVHLVPSTVFAWQYSRTVLVLLVSVIYGVYVFFLTFCTVVLLVLPLNHCRKLVELFVRKVGSRYKSLVSFLLKLWERPVFEARLTNSRCGELRHRHFVIKMVLFPITLVMFLSDLVIAFLRVIHSYILFFLGIVLELLRLIGKAIRRFLEIVTEIPEHKVMKDWFRISGVVSISFIVIANRLSLLFPSDENSTAVLEFIASTIIIPIIFEWIYSAKGNKA